MKKKKIESLNTAEGLVALAKKEHAAAMKEASAREEENTKKIADLTEKEKRLKAEIETAKETLQEMIREFEALEKKERKAILAKIQKSEMTKEDVKSGKITLAQFHAQGVTADEIEATATASTIEALEKSASLIREKAKEIDRAELALCEAQVQIHALLINPVKSLTLAYKLLLDKLDYNLGPLISSHHSAGSKKIHSEERILYIDKGIGFTSGYVWQNLTLEQAYRVRHDPVLPKEHVPSLLEELSDIEPSDTLRLTITYHHKAAHWPGDPLSVRIESD